MIKVPGLNRRSFIRNAGLSALAGAAGLGSAVTPIQVAAQPSARRLAGGKLNLDIPFSHIGFNDSRWDSPARRYGDQFKYGMGIASMDFEAPPCITEALAKRCEHHSWGYISSTDSLREAILQWTGARHGIEIDPATLVISHGVYPGVIAGLRSFVPAGTRTLMLTPIYNGFYSMCRHTRAATVDSPLLFRNGRWEIDWDDLEAKMQPDVNAMIVCNPQNPTGNVWTEEELLRIGRLCLEHQIVVLVDEIHNDFVRAGHRYVPFASLPDRAVVNNSISFGAVSKTFNLAGMKSAYFHSSNPTLLGRVQQNHRSDLTILGMVANEAGYREGGEWFDQVLPYIDANHSFVEQYVRQHMPLVQYKRAEGTFLTFMDFSRVMQAIGATEQAKEQGYESAEHFFQDWLVAQSGVVLNPGTDYGAGSEGHMRMNIASARVVVEGALQAMATAFRHV
ncbi:MAG: aminotransferase class I/II-fold pyridoxal phosphate-dependent enzyme [Pseudohongiellaceae bacterium]